MIQIKKGMAVQYTRTYSYTSEKKINPEIHVLSNQLEFSRRFLVLGLCFFFSGPQTKAHQAMGIRSRTDHLDLLPFLDLLMTCLSPLPNSSCSVALQFLVQGLFLTEQMAST